MIYMKINNDNVVIDASNEPGNGYIEIENEEWPFDILNADEKYCYKYVDGKLYFRTEDEIYGRKDFPPEDTADEEIGEDVSPSIEERVSAIENAFNILLDGM